MIEKLARDLAKFQRDPLGFVLWAFPWEGDYKPDHWQVAVLEDIRMAIEHNQSLPAEQRTPIQIAVASGHGIGKSALMSWINLWFMSCHVAPRVVVTANTFSQLTGKTWAELNKWHEKMVHKHLFQWTAQKYFLKDCPAQWKAEAVPWSQGNSEAFAGTHAENVLYLFDEGSAIDDKIWEVSEGAMTTENCMWIVFGNPTRNTGRFKACFGKYRHRWITRSIDSRCAKMTNKAKIQQWLEDEGEDSDFFRVRVAGKFPNQASNQLISEESVDECIAYNCINYESYPVSICCDVARFGDDLTTIGAYQGRKCLELKSYAKKDLTVVASLVAQCYQYYRNKYHPHIPIRIFTDDVGVGGGVTDILQHNWNLPVTGVNSGGRSNEPETYRNMRDQMWFKAAQAIKTGKYDIPDEPRLKDDLINIEYRMNESQRIVIEPTKSLKDRGLPSPDFGTNFVLQFAYPQLMQITNESPLRKSNKGGGSETMRKRQQYKNQTEGFTRR